MQQHTYLSSGPASSILGGCIMHGKWVLTPRVHKVTHNQRPALVRRTRSDWGTHGTTQRHTARAHVAI